MPRVVRATQPHAFIQGLKTNRALTVPGVKAVVTGDACPSRIGHAIQDQFPIAREKVRYWGEPIAVVIASTLEAAEKAAQLVDLEYEPLPSCLHPYQAAQPGAQLLHPDVANYVHDPLIHPVPNSNICHHYKLARGDIEAAFAQADLIVENDYWIPWIAHVQLEPHGAIALWDGETFTIWSSSQSPFFIRETISKLFAISPARVRVIIPYVGGGFGGKSDVTIEPLLAIAAREVPGVPIKLVLTPRGDVLRYGDWSRSLGTYENGGEFPRVLAGRAGRLVFCQRRLRRLFSLDQPGWWA